MWRLYNFGLVNCKRVKGNTSFCHCRVQCTCARFLAAIITSSSLRFFHSPAIDVGEKCTEREAAEGLDSAIAAEYLSFPLCESSRSDLSSLLKSRLFSPLAGRWFTAAQTAQVGCTWCQSYQLMELCWQVRANPYFLFLFCPNGTRIWYAFLLTWLGSIEPFSVVSLDHHHHVLYHYVAMVITMEVMMSVLHVVWYCTMAPDFQLRYVITADC